MRLVRSTDTSPEMRVRRLAHRLGYRYRLHVSKLPGRPDLVFPGRRKVIFVHGCFWHRHKNCRLARLPKSRLDYWLPKLEGNAKRDKRHIKDLRNLGWTTLIIWECQTKDLEWLAGQISCFLSAGCESSP